VFNNILASTVLTTKVCTEPEPIIVKFFLTYSAWMPALFLGVGAMLNLNKWIYFYMRILAFTKIG
jgi:hypothetical protein